jgi:ParB family chromosome partitioning protein
MRKALGRGLSELLGEQAEGDLQQIAIEAIAPNPNQPRKDFDTETLAELAASIEKVGLMQPIVVRETTAGKYEIIAGERRWRAATIAGLKSIPVVIKKSNDIDTLQMALIENIQREDISSMELAEAYRSLIDAAELTQEDLAARVGKSRTSIANTLRLMKLPEEIRVAVRSGNVSEGHARALLQFETDAERMLVFETIQQRGLSVRDVERLARSGVATPKQRNTAQEPDRLSTQLSERLGAPSKVVRRAKGGRIEIEFFDDDDLARIIDTIGAGD